MNETVKAALLAERQSAKRVVSAKERSLAYLQNEAAAVTGELVTARDRLADIELHLKDNGIDLAVVDAEAARSPSAMQCAAGSNQTAVLNGNYGRGLDSINGDLGNQLRGSLNASNQFDPTAGLVKALNEA